MKIDFDKNVKNVALSLVLVGTITACCVAGPKLLGYYFDEDVKKNRQSVMLITSKNKKEKGKTLNKNRNIKLK